MSVVVELVEGEEPAVLVAVGVGVGEEVGVLLALPALSVGVEDTVREKPAVSLPVLVGEGVDD